MRTLLASVSVLAVSAYTLLPPALPEIAAEFGVTAGEAGLVTVAATLPGIVLAPLLGVLADRYGRRELLIACLLAFAVGGCATAFAPSFAAVIACRLVQGVGGAGLIGLVMAEIGTRWQGPACTTVMGRNAAAIGVAVIAWPALGGVLTSTGGWRLACLPAVGGILAAEAIRRAMPPSPRSTLPMSGQLRAAYVAVRDPRLRKWLVAGAVVFLLLFGLLLTALPEHLDTAFDLQPWQRGLVLALPASTSTMAALLLGRVTTKWGADAVMTAGFAIVAIAFAAVALAPSAPVVGLALLGYGLGEGLLIPTIQTAAAGAGTAANRGTTVAVFVSCARLGQTSGPLLVAPIVAGPGPETAFALGALTAGCLAVAGLRQSVPAAALRRPGAQWRT